MTTLVRDRRLFLAYFSSLGLTSTLLPGVLWAKVEEEKPARITKEMLRMAASVAGVQFTEAQFERMLQGVNDNLGKYEEIRKVELDNSVAPPLYFNPIVPGMKIERTRRAFRVSEAPKLSRPHNLEEVAFWPAMHLGELIRTKQVSSVELTEMYLGRLKRYNPKLLCAVTITEELAMKQAREADREIAGGHYRGALHGVPYGIKDLAAARDYPTTWGAAPFKNRIIDRDATVVSRLREAGGGVGAQPAAGELGREDGGFGGHTKKTGGLSRGWQGAARATGWGLNW